MTCGYDISPSYRACTHKPLRIPDNGLPYPSKITINIILSHYILMWSAKSPSATMGPVYSGTHNCHQYGCWGGLVYIKAAIRTF